MEIVNRVARHDYFIEDEYECGMVLTGTEIKSIRLGKANIKDSYAVIKNREIFLLNMFISHYKEGNIFNHNETRTRKLLLHRSEILKLNDKVRLEGYTLIPLKIYFVKGKAKLLLGVCKGKKNYDKREALKEKDIKRQVAKDLKNKY
ncbi:MAG TPA: SsrA-binding protein SmpB [Candidatus Scybalousia intestinigallinarum]|nr:SsrA-binding protein SmpB [Candidatus Scybalousia intestinigallinarum]